MFTRARITWSNSSRATNVIPCRLGARMVVRQRLLFAAAIPIRTLLFGIQPVVVSNTVSTTPPTTQTIWSLLIAQGLSGSVSCRPAHFADAPKDRHADRGLPAGESGAVTVIQRANSDLRLNPHVHALFLDGLYAPDRDGKGQMFHPAPAPSQQDVEQVVERASKRILRFLQRRGVITLVTAPGDGEVTVVGDDSMDEKDPLLARLLAAAAAGAPPAGPANKRKPVRIVLDPDDHPVTKGTLCSQAQGFNLHAATRVAANDKPGRETLCRYILRPPLANDRLHILPDGNLRLDRHCDGNPGRVPKPSRDGTRRAKLAGSPRVPLV